MISRARPSASTRVALALALAAAGCNRLAGTPTDRGSLSYRIGALTLELPDGWVARGGAVRLTAEAPDGMARVEAERVAREFTSGSECLERAEQSIARSAVALERARHHPTKVGDRAAVALEADLRGWHGWAWAICDGRDQYRLSFYGASPMGPEAIAAQRGLESSARFDGRR